jgi:hypothetical protein
MIKGWANISVRTDTHSRVLELSLEQDTSMATVVQRAVRCYQETGMAALDTEGVKANLDQEAD